MLLTGPGTFEFVLVAGPSHDESASVSSPVPTIVQIFHNEQLVDEVYTSGSTHTWWNSNPLLRYPEAGDKVKIVISGIASMRIDWPLVESK